MTTTKAAVPDVTTRRVAGPPRRQPAGMTQPLYRQVAADLRGQILSGQLKPGERLPSMRELQEQYSIAGMTARAALHLLQAEGLADVVQGRGTYVADAPHRDAAQAKETGKDRRHEQVEHSLREVLSRIRPQGHPSWELNTCLVSNEELARWWAALGDAPQQQNPQR